MKVGIVGLGRMGAGMVARFLAGSHSVYAFDLNPDSKKPFQDNSLFQYSDSMQGLLTSLKEDNSSTQSIIWVMVPAGDPVDACIAELLSFKEQGLLSDKDIIVDGGNSNYHHTLRRAKTVSDSGLSLVDVGTSGGVWGESQGFCMMVGGEKEAYENISPLLKSLCHEGGFDYMGPSGSGHYVKMVHNAVEYALMQSYGEGMDLLASGPYDLSLHDIVKVWNRGGVIRSWLLELGEGMLKEDPQLDSIQGYIQDSGTGKWSVEEALRFEVPVPMLSQALFNRYRSRKENSISDRFIAGLRKAFGGHSVKKSS